METTTTEKQDSQKTVVAFIAGLLIGGLLVWVFSSSPSDNAPAANDDDANGAAELDDSRSADTARTTDTQSSSNSEVSRTSSGGSLSIENQAAGSVVSVGELSFPTTEGWVAVRDYDGGTLGNILGASRYNTDVGLLPTSVSLLRATEPGVTYAVVFYNENGDRVFDPSDDEVIEGIMDTFTAQ